MKSKEKKRIRNCKILKLAFSLLILNFAVIVMGESIVFEGKLPGSVKIKKEKDGTVLCLNSPQAVNLSLKENTVEANVLYKLSFQAKISGPGGSSKFDPKKNKDFPSWEIRIKDAQDRLPYEGHLKYPWQKCFSAKWRTYQQSFYTPATGRKLQLIISNGSGKNSLMVRNIKLKKVISQNILINSDFAGGEFDYSGWNELSKAKLATAGDKTKLEIQAGGYALSDAVPICPGKYTFGGRIFPELFFYDADMIRLNCKRIRTRTFSTPDKAAYLRFFFGAGKISEISLRCIKKEGK